MVWKIKITASAKADITNIKNWYRKASFIVLENFTKELIISIESLQNNIVEHKTVHGNYRRLLLKRFPYTIYYQRKQNFVEINAVFHNSRNSEIISNRLND